MHSPSPRRIRALILSLIAAAGALAFYKVSVLGYALTDVLPQARYDVTLEMTLDGHGRDVAVRTWQPQSDGRQLLSDEEMSAPGLHFDSEQEGLNRRAIWRGTGVADDSHIRVSYGVLSRPIRFELEEGIDVPAVYPQSVASYLRPEPDVQVDAPEIRRTADRLRLAEEGAAERLRRIYDFTAALETRPFKGTTDALTALRLEQASCNGKSRLFVALARASGIPARLIGGFVMNPGSKRTSHQWVEAYVSGHWVPYDPTNHHVAELPAHYLTLYYGDEALFSHSQDINFDYRFTVTKTLVPSPKARTAFGAFNVWALFERLDLPFSLLRTILMLPIGALVVVLFRNVIGMPTFGTFLPALIAAAAGQTGPLWGLVGLLMVMCAVVVARALVQRLRLLHSPTLAILLAAVTTSMLATSLAAEHLDLARLTRISMFPIAVLAITAERFFLSLTEQGPREAAKYMLGTSIVILACYVVMNSLALQILVVGFPEVILLVIAADIYLGRWIGMRLGEYLRFAPLFDSRGPGDER